MKTSSVLYQIVIFLYKLFPYKLLISKLLRNSNFIKKRKRYQDFMFYGVFNVNIESINKRFKLFNWKSSIETSIFWTGLENGDWENETIPVWIKLCKKSNVIMDVGANTGVYSLIAKSVNPNSLVYAFEPSTLIIDKIKRNIKINGFDINLIEKGVSNETGELIFYDVKDKHQTSASLNPAKLKHLNEFSGKINEYFINTIRLDEFIEENSIVPDLIKIDVELHEPQVIDGLGIYLIKFEPIIIVEVLTELIAERLHCMLDECGYEYYAMYRQHIEKVSQMKPIEGIFNYLIVPKSKSLSDIF